MEADDVGLRLDLGGGPGVVTIDRGVVCDTLHVK